jgi:transcriptional regulator with GAF, ATPase, and Fis domain
MAVWRANVPEDVCAWAGGLYRGMARLPVLITGETGTGKEVAAKCIARGRYIPFDVKERRFLKRPKEDCHARNLSEASDGLFESTIFGHKRGAYTGATSDSPGFFGLAELYGSLLLDEFGDLEKHLQVKLLRPLESRRYTPVGEVHEREILCRLMFATNCDLEAKVRAGTFRQDLFQRLNAVRVHMPPLRQMLAEAPDDIRAYVRAFVVESGVHPEQVESVTERVVAGIRAKKPGYLWPGNVRELRGVAAECLVGPVEPPPPDAPAQTTGAPASPEASTAPASPTAPPPPSSCVPESYERLLEQAKAGKVRLEELDRAHVTWMCVLANENESEAARWTGWSTAVAWRVG